MRLGSRSILVSLFALWPMTGCLESEPIDFDAGALGTGAPGMGLAGTNGGGAGVNGSTGQAGTGGGIAGTNGVLAGPSGGGAGTSGLTGTTGQAGAAGQAGTTGQAGTGGGVDGGAAGTTGGQAGQSGRDAGTTQDAGTTTDGPVPTFTDLYTNMFNSTSYASNCTGGGCHNPGTQKGLDFSTKAKGYSTILGKVVVGNPTASSLVSQLSSGKMPQARPKMPAADLAKVSAWIKAGAPNN